MKIEEAIEILEKHNEWRRYNGDIDKSPEMAHPKELGKAIDTVVNHYEKNKCPKCNVEINYTGICEICWYEKKQL